MKIVHIEDFFYPSAGYQINILPKYLQKLGHENFIITSEYNKTPLDLRSFFKEDNIKEKDEEFSRLTNVNIIRMPIYGFISGRAIWKFMSLVKEIENINPDLIYVHGNDTLIGMQVIGFYKNKKRRVITDSHMLEMASKNKFNKVFRKLYKYTISKIINKNDINVIRVQNTNFVFDNYHIRRELSPFISFGTDSDLFIREDDKTINKIKQELGIKNKNVYIYSGKLNEEKGAKFLLNGFKDKFNKHEVTLIILSNIPNNEYGKELQNLIDNSKNQILVLGIKEYYELPKYYSLAKYAVFPKQCSLSFFDFQSMGIPVIFEDNEINSQRVHNSNIIFKSNDLEDFRNTISKSLEINNTSYKNKSENAIRWIKANYDYNNIVMEYDNLISESVRTKV